ncbi:hypothetical protein HYPSUDRAFT_50033 [Hypholoma sublateritium FD-334 SS-4]|uniref:Uncharacterized protein n=1 Tax=Hypholoma sublateritium (strain FD-334 SS-4) TaxID=945553 RepID=A0A0D2N1F0_HYPSF|nr:hypothetical protein HYPSUDRAFT_50033 [Hypholoma sublateritium FD-334 SS-4]
MPNHTARDKVRYEIRVHSAPTPIIKYEVIPLELRVLHPPQAQAIRFLAGLAAKYDKQVLNSRPWVCWNCPARAVGLVHTPASYMHNPEPLIIDIVQPVCANGGACDAAARKMMAEEMNF